MSKLINEMEHLKWVAYDNLSTKKKILYGKKPTTSKIRVEYRFKCQERGRNHFCQNQTIYEVTLRIIILHLTYFPFSPAPYLFILNHIFDNTLPTANFLKQYRSRFDKDKVNCFPKNRFHNFIATDQDVLLSLFYSYDPRSQCFAAIVYLALIECNQKV